MKRILLYFLGLNLIAAAVVLNIRFDFGVAAFSSTMYTISEIYKISLGTSSIICYLLFVLAQCILSKKVTLPYLLEVPLSFAFGFLTDLYDFFIPDMEFHVLLRILLFAITMFVTTISEVFSIAFSTVKNTFDISMVIISVLLCLGNHTKLYGIGIGTILSALLLGRIINIYEKHLPMNIS